MPRRSTAAVQQNVQINNKKAVLSRGNRAMPLYFSKMAAGRHPGFDRTGNSAIRSADPENPTLESNMKLTGSPVEEIWPFEIQHITMVHLGPLF